MLMDYDYPMCYVAASEIPYDASGASGWCGNGELGAGRFVMNEAQAGDQ
jgi:hypothetical protein